GPISPMGFHHLIQRLGKAAKMPFAIHPHMLRHGCGFKLANDGHATRSLQHYLGHKNIHHTVRYTDISPDRCRDFWRYLSERATPLARLPARGRTAGPRDDKQRVEQCSFLEFDVMRAREPVCGCAERVQNDPDYIFSLPWPSMSGSRK